jgi:hypothetical protein
MIRYRLTCDQGHEFESWFGSSAAYEDLLARELISCGRCGSNKVSKALMAPSVAKRGRPKEKPQAPAKPVAEPTPAPAPVQSMATALPPEIRDAVRRLRTYIRENSEYVGPRFAEEARKIHYEEAEARGIHGEATPGEAQELIEEGIEVQPIPDLPEDQN